ncbi:MAG: zf-HC2 domain-containing protein, partial [Gemmatimonadota bacterium]
MNTGCGFQDGLAPYAAGRMDGDEARRLERHLRECDECRGALAVVRAVRRSTVSVPEGLEARIQAAVRAAVPEGRPHFDIVDGGSEQPRGRRLAWLPRGARWWGAPLAAAAAVALVWAGLADRGPGDEAQAGLELAEIAAEYEPDPVWPGADGVVAGDPLLS